MHLTRDPRAWLTAAALPLAVVALASCGGSSSTSAATSTTASQDAARVKFTRCLRENGVDLPDDVGAGGTARALQDVDQTKLQTAMKACQKYQQAAVGAISSDQQQEFRDAFTKFSACMRRHGVEVPDIGTSGLPPAGGGQLDRSDPKVKAATTACASSLPRGVAGGSGQ